MDATGTREKSFGILAHGDDATGNHSCVDEHSKVAVSGPGSGAVVVECSKAVTLASDPEKSPRSKRLCIVIGIATVMLLLCCFLVKCRTLKQYAASVPGDITTRQLNACQSTSQFIHTVKQKSNYIAETKQQSMRIKYDELVIPFVALIPGGHSMDQLMAMVSKAWGLNFYQRMDNGHAHHWCRFLDLNVRVQFTEKSYEDLNSGQCELDKYDSAIVWMSYTENQKNESFKQLYANIRVKKPKNTLVVVKDTQNIEFEKFKTKCTLSTSMELVCVQDTDCSAMLKWIDDRLAAIVNEKRLPSH